jgi:hypothetical protein
MGLFTRSKKAKRVSPERKAEQERRAESARRGLTLMATMLVFCGLLAAFVAGVPRLERSLGAQAQAQPLKVAFQWPAGGAAPGETWLPIEVRDELLALAHAELERSPDPFSAQGLRGVGHALRRTGWFESIRAVTREAGGVVRVDAAWRDPAAVVRCEGIDYVVAKGGEVLPVAYQRGGSGRMAILGASLTPPKSGGRIVTGGVWPGTDVRAGLELLRTISNKPWRDQVVAVDVTEYLSKRTLALVTRWNGRIAWGGAPGESRPGEASTEAKLVRLDILVKEFGQIDAKRRLVEVAGPILLVDDTATANAQ